MTDKAGYFVANRDVTIATKFGHTIAFRKDVPTYVPPMVRGIMSTYGILPTAGSPPLNTDPESKLREKDTKVQDAVEIAQQADPEYRKERILEAIINFRDNEVRAAFAASGLPKVRSLTKAVGFEVTSTERDAIWQEMQRTSEPVIRG